MAHRQVKNSKGIYKAQLRNIQCKFLVNQHEKSLIEAESANRDIIQSEYLRDLILETPHRTAKAQNTSGYSLMETVVTLGRRLNILTKTIHESCLRNETIVIDTSQQQILIDINQCLEFVAARANQIAVQMHDFRNIQVKFLVTPTELEEIEAKLKQKELKLSKYMRQQITGYREEKHKSKAIEMSRQLSRLDNNINQLYSAIVTEERSHRLIIIEPQTKFAMAHLRDTINQIQEQLRPA
jgi:hypothetical protein